MNKRSAALEEHTSCKYLSEMLCMCVCHPYALFLSCYATMHS